MPASLKRSLVGPLPAILELGLVDRFIVGGIQIIDARFQARIHDRQILIRQGDIEHQIGLVFFDQRHHLRHIVRIHLLGGNRPRQCRRNGIALGLGPAGQNDLVKDLRHLRTFMHHHIADPAGTDNQYFCHDRFSMQKRDTSLQLTVKSISLMQVKSSHLSKIAQGLESLFFLLGEDVFL